MNSTTLSSSLQRDQKVLSYNTSIQDNSSTRKPPKAVLRMQTYTGIPKTLNKAQSLKLDILNKTPNKKLKQHNTQTNLTQMNSGGADMTSITETKKSRKKMTLNFLKNEVFKMQNIIANSPCALDEAIILQRLRVKKIDYKHKLIPNLTIQLGLKNNKSLPHVDDSTRAASVTKSRPSSHKPNVKNVVKTKEKQRKEEETAKRWNDFVNTVNNPSYGIDGIKRKYPGFARKVNFQINCSFGQKYQVKSLTTTMLAQKLDKKHNDLAHFDLKRKNKLTQASRLKLKCKTIKWLVDNHKEILNRMLEPRFQETLLNFSDKKERQFNCGITFEEFGSLLRNNNITNDIEVIQKLFWILDEDGDNDLKYTEITSGVEMFRDTTPEEKVKMFFRLCDANKSGTVTKQEFFNLLKRNIIDKGDIYLLKKCVEKIFHEFADESGVLTLDKFMCGFYKYRELGNVISKNMLSLKTIDTTIDNDIINDFMKFHSEQDLYIRQKIAGGSCKSIPLLERKFGRLVTQFCANKEKEEQRLLKKKNDESSSFEYEEEQKDDDIFKEEREIYDFVMEKAKKNK